MNWIGTVLVPFLFSNSVSVVNGIGYFCVIFSGYLGYRAVERRLISRHTVNTLLELLVNPLLTEGLIILDNHIARDLYVLEGKLQDDDGVDSTKSLDMLMNFYEFMAGGYKRGLLDKEVMETQYVKPLHDSFVVLEELIKMRRRAWDRPTYMKELQWFAEVVAPKMKQWLEIEDPLTRDKMLRNRMNNDRVSSS